MIVSVFTGPTSVHVSIVKSGPDLSINIVHAVRLSSIIFQAASLAHDTMKDPVPSSNVVTSPVPCHINVLVPLYPLAHSHHCVIGVIVITAQPDKVTVGGIDIYIQAQSSVNVTVTLIIPAAVGSGVPTTLATTGFVLSKLTAKPSVTPVTWAAGFPAIS